MNQAQVVRTGRVLRVMVATQANGNTLDMAAVREAAAAIGALTENPGAAGCVLITGMGAHFCTGGNVKDFAAADDPSALIAGMASDLHGLIRAMVASPVPVVAAVHGWAAGAGMSIACAADVIVGGPSTRFRAAYPGVGLSPDGGMSWTLPRAIGAARARDLILTNRAVEGEQAYRLGLLTRLVSDEDIRPTAEKIAEELAEGPATSYARIRELLWTAPDRSFTGQLDAEAESIAWCAGSPAGREGAAAFAEGRPPRFTELDQ
ncbi:MAG: 2-(1,2-epoxy,2-dihydrophenyl)acetyl-CoA isomerase [Actinomycetota bacterium]|jgi:2-(1,2-epoxy-1,2-dihydrophenyl)acetyl-CoA isomerase|nr:2-(1,2-epoxy,2-dihydrophenyl)acetyl-CoA isomerase [Actinomycetota bacterium]